MKGTLHKTEDGWQVSHATYDLVLQRWTAGRFPIHPHDLNSEIIRWANNGSLDGKEVEFEWCVILQPDGKGKEYARLTEPKRNIDLQNLETKLDQALSEETDWTLSRWLKSKREQKELITEIMNEDAKDRLYDDAIQKSAKQSWEGCDGCTEAEETFYLNGYVRGYNAAIADSYTEEQVKEPIKEMIKFIDDINDNDRSEFNYYYDHIMDKLKELLESKKD